MFEISQLAQATREIFDGDYRLVIRQANNLIRSTRDNTITFSFLRMDVSPLQDIGVYNKSLAENRDYTTHLEYIVFKVMRWRKRPNCFQILQSQRNHSFRKRCRANSS